MEYSNTTLSELVRQLERINAFLYGAEDSAVSSSRLSSMKDEIEDEILRRRK